MQSSFSPGWVRLDPVKLCFDLFDFEMIVPICSWHPSDRIWCTEIAWLDLEASENAEHRRGP